MVERVFLTGGNRRGQVGIETNDESHGMDDRQNSGPVGRKRKLVFFLDSRDKDTGANTFKGIFFD